jgi:A/G-specific adenine glycosylase
MNISGALISWYKQHQRDLPWRQTTDPYRIWLSEIILQQTRVDQGMPYYLKFASTFPKICNLAKASEDQVLKIWQGLGYYSRARNLHRTAKIVCNDYKGIFPSDFQSIISLPGIGDYTASAIASFAWKQPHAVVDGNVNRILSRLFGVKEPIDSPQGKKIFKNLATSILPEKHADIHNQAIMEFGALQCKPQSPNCSICPFLKTCYAAQHQLVDQLPVKTKNLKIKVRHLHYILICQEEHLFIRKRDDKGIWKGLYELPFLETEKELSPEKVIGLEAWTQLFGNADPEIIRTEHKTVHKLTHQHLHLQTIEVRLKNRRRFPADKDLIRVSTQNIEDYPVPKPIEKILRSRFS